MSMLRYINEQKYQGNFCSLIYRSIEIIGDIPTPPTKNTALLSVSLFHINSPIGPAICKVSPVFISDKVFVQLPYTLIQNSRWSFVRGEDAMENVCISCGFPY